jgi:hypothetical protein
VWDATFADAQLDAHHDSGASSCLFPASSPVVL